MDPEDEGHDPERPQRPWEPGVEQLNICGEKAYSTAVLFCCWPVLFWSSAKWAGEIGRECGNEPRNSPQRQPPRDGLQGWSVREPLERLFSSDVTRENLTGCQAAKMTTSYVQGSIVESLNCFGLLLMLSARNHSGNLKYAAIEVLRLVIITARTVACRERHEVYLLVCVWAWHVDMRVVPMHYSDVNELLMLLVDEQVVTVIHLHEFSPWLL